MDNINPAHYKGNIECIEAIKTALGDYNFQHYLRGQVFKYLWRMDKKGQMIDDIKKAKWYLDRLNKEIDNSFNEPPDTKD